MSAAMADNRPGDTDMMGVSGLDCLAFRYFAELSGLVPLVGINAGYCFAGNAAILGCCDVVIATADSNIGMGGPAMIERSGKVKATPYRIDASYPQFDAASPDFGALGCVSREGVLECPRPSLAILVWPDAGPPHPFHRRLSRHECNAPSWRTRVVADERRTPR